MAHIVDLRRTGGAIVFLGDTLTLPISSEDVIEGDEPFVGSMRFNPERDLVEVFGKDRQWKSTQPEAAEWLQTSGGALSGDLLLRQNARLLTDNGSLDRPSVSFETQPGSGLSVSPSGSVQISTKGELALSVEKVQIVSKVEMKAPLGRFDYGVFLSAASDFHDIEELQSNTALIDAGWFNTVDANSVKAQDFHLGDRWDVVEGAARVRFTYDNVAAATIHANSTIEADIFTGKAMTAANADLAERYHADAAYEPGTVLVIGGQYEVTTTTKYADPRVAGVVSTAPGMKLNSDAGDDDTHPYIALKGRVPCKVKGPVWKGDIVVTSSHPGYAQATDLAPSASIIGKALQDFPGWDFGVIEIMVI